MLMKDELFVICAITEKVRLSIVLDVVPEWSVC